MKKIGTYFLPLSFLFLLMFPLLNSGEWLLHFERENENRLIHELQFNPRNINSFPAQFDQYYSDNFSFRTPLLKIFHKIKFHFFHVSSDKELVLIGKNGWYFLGGKEKEIYEGRSHFTNETLERYTALWKHRMAFLTAQKIKVYWLICPSKAEIYPENLPENVIRIKLNSRTAQLKAHLDKTFPHLVLDPAPFLRQEKVRHKMYYKLDNHWTNRAGNSVSAFILEQLKKDFPLLSSDYLNQYTWQTIRKKDGIHKKALGINNMDESNDIARPKESSAKETDRYGFVAPKSFAYPWKFEIRFVNKNKGHYRILIIRDSFGDALLPFLKEAFEESVFIFDNWEYKLNEEIIKKVKPDIVLYVSLDTHVENFLIH